MAELIEAFDPPGWSVSEDLFASTVETITGQQLSVKAAASIFGRLLALMPAGKIRPQSILELNEEDLRGVGLSRAKTRSIRELAERVSSGEVDLEALRTLPDDELVAHLVQLRGIGPWTAEMLLMFDFGRPDVFSMGDLGLRTAVSRLYGVDRDDRDAIAAISERWSPYRSSACHYLWASLQNKPRTSEGEIST